jgi:hypothetical protein
MNGDVLKSNVDDPTFDDSHQGQVDSWDSDIWRERFIEFLMSVLSDLPDALGDGVFRR